MTRSQLAIVGILAGLSGPLTIGFATAQSDPYAPTRVRPQNQGARGIEIYDRRNDANVRVGTKCLLVIEGDEVYRGICNVGRRDRVSIIDTGSSTYKIERDEFDDRSATLTRNGRFIDTVTAYGSCWRNDRSGTRYCAN